MRTSYLSGAILASAIIISACSGQTGVSPAPGAQHLASVASHASGSSDFDSCPADRVYVADYAKSDVEIYPQGVNAPAPCGKIAKGVDFPEAVYVDAKGRVYVSNYPVATVTEYVGGSEKLSISLAGPAFDLFVGANSILYVAETSSDQVAEYKAGATAPYQTLAINGEPFGVATDSHNDLYVAYLSNSDSLSHVEKFKPKATTGTDLGFTVGFSGEVKLDSANDVIIGDRNTSTVYVYPPGSKTPSRSFQPAGRPVFFALDNSETNFYVSIQGQVQIIDYATGNGVATISNGLISPSGVALSPPAPY